MKAGNIQQVIVNMSLRLSCVTNSSTGSSLLQASAVKHDTPEQYPFFLFQHLVLFEVTQAIICTLLFPSVRQFKTKSMLLSFSTVQYTF